MICTLLVALTLGFSPAVQARLDAPFVQSLTARYGTEAKRRGQALTALIQQLRTEHAVQTTEEWSGAIEAVNQFFNRLAYRTDRELWGRDDYWASPLEFIGKGAGDCEDFALGKYFALRAVGVPVDKLEITYVRRPYEARSHMVLIYRQSPLQSAALVLDNEFGLVASLQDRPDLIVIYGFNDDNLSVPTSSGAAILPFGARHRAPKNWSGLLSRLAL